MATHRRGLRPAQWPVRNLLGDQRPAPGGLRDPRLYAAVGGLLACGAAATVAFTASDGGSGRGTGPGPMALPAPGAGSTAPPAPGAAPPPGAMPGDSAPDDSAPDDSAPADSGPADAVPADPGRADPAPPRARGGPRTAPVPRAWRAAAATDRDRSVRELADRLAAELVGRQGRPSADGTVEALLVVPLQREADVTALLTRVRIDARCAASQDRPGRHRAPECGDGDRERSVVAWADRDDADRDRADADHDRADRDDDRDANDGDRDEDGDAGDGDAGDGDGDDRDDGVGGEAAADTGADPAMAVLAAAGEGRSGAVAVCRIDSGAVLAALGDLHPDGTVRGRGAPRGGAA